MSKEILFTLNIFSEKKNNNPLNKLKHLQRKNFVIS